MISAPLVVTFHHLYNHHFKIFPVLEGSKKFAPGGLLEDLRYLQFAASHGWNAGVVDVALVLCSHVENVSWGGT